MTVVADPTLPFCNVGVPARKTADRWNDLNSWVRAADGGDFEL